MTNLTFALWAAAASLLACTAFGLIGYGVVLERRRRLLRVRLAVMATDAVVSGDSRRPAGPAAHVALAQAGAALARALPSRLVERLELRSIRAGLTGRTTADVLLAARVLAILSGGGLAYLFAHSDRGALSAFGAVIVAAVSLFGVDVYLHSRAQTRRRAAEHDLATILDVLTLTLAAGMGFDNALETILVHFRGPLVDELSRYLTETRTLGAQRTLALREVPNRLGDPPDLVEFVDAVNRAQVMGTGLLAAVDSQMVLLRQERRRRVASAAARAPVRMLIPMTLFMLPVLMLTVLAPVGLRLANSVGGLH